MCIKLYSYHSWTELVLQFKFIFSQLRTEVQYYCRLPTGVTVAYYGGDFIGVVGLYSVVKILKLVHYVFVASVEHSKSIKIIKLANNNNTLLECSIRSRCFESDRDAWQNYWGISSILKIISWMHDEWCNFKFIEWNYNKCSKLNELYKVLFLL